MDGYYGDERRRSCRLIAERRAVAFLGIFSLVPEGLGGGIFGIQDSRNQTRSVARRTKRKRSKETQHPRSNRIVRERWTHLSSLRVSSTTDITRAASKLFMGGPVFCDFVSLLVDAPGLRGTARQPQ